jgi:hypothetical protein
MNEILEVKNEFISIQSNPGVLFLNRIFMKKHVVNNLGIKNMK